MMDAIMYLLGTLWILCFIGIVILIILMVIAVNKEKDF